MRNKWKTIVWGLVLLAIAAMIILQGFGYFEGIKIIKIILSGIFAGAIITSIPSLNFFGILFPAALILIMFDKQLGIEELTPWPVIAIAILGSIGLTLITRVLGFRPHSECYKKDKSVEWETEVIGSESGENIMCEASFSGQTKYIKSDNLCSVDIRSKFSGMKIYFDGSKIPSGRATINVDAKFGGIELYIPSDWKIETKTSCAFGDCVINGNAMLTPESPEVLITGSVQFGEVKVYYV